MNIPDEVMKRARSEFYHQHPLLTDLGLEAAAQYIADWARKEALREAAEAVAKVDELDEYRDSDGEDYFWTINPEPFVDAVRALMAEGVSDGQQ